MTSLDGKVAFITGAARGQGRSHALALAREGADVVAIDIAREDAFETVPYTLGSEADLDETIAAIEDLGRRALKVIADVRDFAQMEAAVQSAVETFGGIDIVCANAGIGSFYVSWEITPEQWQDMIDVNLTGVFNTARAALPSMIERGEGGSIVLTSSTAGLIGYLNTAHYTAAKHGVIGLMKVLAQELGEHHIRVNAVCPTTVGTPMVVNQTTFDLFAPDVANPGPADVHDAFAALNSIPGVPWIEPEDVSAAVVWLCSDAARYITGVAMPVDAGNIVKKTYG